MMVGSEEMSNVRPDPLDAIDFGIGGFYETSGLKHLRINKT
jgi:hypothetical protein